MKRGYSTVRWAVKDQEASEMKHDCNHSRGGQSSSKQGAGGKSKRVNFLAETQPI